MIAARAAGRVAALAASYTVPALVLAWLLGGQAQLGRIDAALAVPLLMPGALLLARLTRDDAPRARIALIGVAVLLLCAAQAALHLLLARRLGFDSLLFALIMGLLCCLAADAVVQRTRGWQGWLRGAAFMLAAAAWFAIGLIALAWHYRDPAPDRRPPVAMLTGLPLRWASGGDIARMLAEGPGDVPALTAIEQAVNLRLVDTLDDLRPRETLLLAHPRALAPVDLVRIDAHVRAGGDAVILADALSSWPPPHPLGDPRNPPVTSLLTPLLDHWGIELAAPSADAAGDIEIFIGRDGAKLRLHSAGRFVRLPATCQAYGGERVAHCAIGRGEVWLVGDADMLHAGQWLSPIAQAPWLRRSDNIAWLVDLLRGGDGRSRPAPLWIRSHGV